ncbi:Synaptojanin-1 [Fulvia fulva]|uniref:Synaptojanin-1 n=1 Tax=Passalora fulva TaxID=5499 RepID=A0A9Q8P9P2_PASFU|nr:Synaptojanin-1 [Fulvia fulva]UJO18495.1 Synaptojanin-1 [Fulvia fulva]
MSTTRSRPMSTASASTASSLMQDVPGAFPATPPFRPEPEEENDRDEEHEVTYQSLSQAVYARRAEYVRPKHVRIKVGTWNTAACKGVEKDLGRWFVGGKGVAEALTGLSINDPDRDGSNRRESVAAQEDRYERKQPTLPKGDEGSLPKDADVGLYVLGLQEVVDITSASEALKPYTDPSVAAKWKDAMQQAIPTGYQLVAEQQLLGLLLLIYAAPDVAPDVKSVSTTSVGTGLMGYMGNKGAVTARIVLGETTRMVFVNSHLAAGADKTALERRNWDASQIISRTRFAPIKDAMDLAQSTGEQIGDEDFAFWCGDLNYRLEAIPGDDVRRLLMLHTRNEYDLSQKAARKIDQELEEATNSVKERTAHDDGSGRGSAASSVRNSLEYQTPTTLVDEVAASEDPSSLQTTLSSLLPHDELHQQMKARKAFHDGWQEGPITFLPTYKYDIGSVGVFDSSEKKRAPSWCDRIIYRTRREKLAYDAKVRDEENARKKDEEMKANGTVAAASDEDILYDYDPDTDGADAIDNYNEYDEYDDQEDGVVITKEGFEDAIKLEYYTAHQRVLSSDHKPLDASFMLKYDAVVPELKAQIHSEVAKELDKAENEGRPNVTVIVDAHNDTPATSEENSTDKFEGVWFGDVRWMQTKHRSLTVANTSRVPANFSFIERPVDESQQAGIAPDWLSLKINDHDVKSEKSQSETITLEPGETCSIELELKITALGDVQDLNSNKQNLEDILVLRVENGRDHFVPVRAHWLSSSLGRSIDKLVRIPEGGIRKLQRQQPHAKTKAAANTVSAAQELSKNIDRSLSPISTGSTESIAGRLRGLSSSSSNKDKSPISPSSASQDSDLPVRFSAPRELFRLTEAVEELSTRVVAEWEMTHSADPAMYNARESSDRPVRPWEGRPAWPFDEACWQAQSTPHWDNELSDACDALDSDESLTASFALDISTPQRLYILSSLLLTFLRSMSDGIVTAKLWPEVDKYLTDIDKSKKKPSNDDQRTAIQEILSQSPSHSISYILIVSTLERMIQERSTSNISRASTRGHSHSSSTLSAEAPMSPTQRAGGTFKRMFAGKGNATGPSERDQSSKAMAAVIAEVVVRTSDAASEKAKAPVRKRKADLIELFLKRDEPG